MSARKRARDPVKADPKHFKVDVEDAQVRLRLFLQLYDLGRKELYFDVVAGVQRIRPGLSDPSLGERRG